MDENNDIRAVIEPSVLGLGYEIIRLKWMGGDKYKTLQIMIEPENGEATRVEDCEKVSHTVSALLDVEDIIQGAYRLEVSSPGIDRPLTRRKDFESYKGFETKLETREGIDGRRKFRGKVTKLDDDKIEFALSDEKKSFTIPWGKISEAKLVLTDDLVKFVSKNIGGKPGAMEGKEIEVNELKINN